MPRPILFASDGRPLQRGAGFTAGFQAPDPARSDLVSSSAVVPDEEQAMEFCEGAD